MLITYPGKLTGIGGNGDVVDVDDDVALHLLEEELAIEVSGDVIDAEPVAAPEPEDDTEDE
jgi:hypothetical protein